MRRVGVIGGGQLAWMMGSAAEALGIELAIQTPHQSDPAVAIAAKTILAPVDDARATAELASCCDVITFENEFVNLEALSSLENQGVRFAPSLSALAPLLDKYHQRCYLRDLGLPVPQFAALEKRGNLPSNSNDAESNPDRMPHFPFPFPLVMKARRHGYDGQGTVIIEDAHVLESTWAQWGSPPVLLEEFVPFERELAIVAARNSSGEIAIYPIVETQQENQVCRRVLVPAHLAPSVVAESEAIARTLLESLQAVGVFGIELFLTADGKVIVNEIAPRTHNSGHFTLDACETSQFEMQLRVVCDLPLGSTALGSAGAVMVNLLGYEHSHDPYLNKRQQLALLPGACVHWYGKTESRPGRKLGHVTVLLEDQTPADVRQRGVAIAQTVESIWFP